MIYVILLHLLRQKVGPLYCILEKLLGHKKSTTTERYAHIANNPVKELNENVGNLIKDSMKNIWKIQSLLSNQIMTYVLQVYMSI